VDNASSDGSVNGLQGLDLPLTVIQNAENRGYAVACNQGVFDSSADYLLFLNPDTRLFTNSLARPLSFMEHPSSQGIGIVGIQLVGDDKEIGRTCSNFPTTRSFFSRMLGLNRFFPQCFPSHFMSNWDHQESRVVDHVVGAFFLVRRSLFHKLGGFDERFFMYLEDLDFSLRAWQHGWHSYYLADVQAHHLGGGTSNQIKATRLFYALRSRILYGYKNFGWCSATALMMGTLFLEPLARSVLGIARRSGKDIRETFRGYSMLWSSIPTLLNAILKRKES